MKKILIIDTVYPKVLDNLRRKLKREKRFSYEYALNNLFNLRFGTSDIYSRLLNLNGWDSETVIANSPLLQFSWKEQFRDRNKGIYRNSFILTNVLFDLIHSFPYTKNWLTNILLSQIHYHKPDIVYLQDLNFIDFQTLKSIRNSGIFIVGQIASPLPNNQIIRMYDHIYSSLPNLVNKINSMGTSASFLPIGFDSRVSKEIPNVEQRDLLTFVGGISSIHSNTLPLLQQVLDHHPELKIYGYGKREAKNSKSIYRVHLGEAWGLDMYKIFQNSYLTLNRHSEVSGPYANNMRLFESTGMGSLLLTDNKINISDYFIPNEEILVYDNFQHASDLVKWVKDNPGKARKIAENGLKRTLQDHTYEKVIGNLSKDLKNRL
jgi:hypothetical protein